MASGLTRRDPPPAWSGWNAGLPAIALAGFGGAICLAYGRIGLMPLDQSIVFDGGWRVLSGQVPLRDFALPSGLVPVALQGLFFRLLGTTWLALCLHAALLNGLFCVMVYALLLRFGGTRLASAGFAACAGVTFYPPFGTPFMDQHAFFFGFLAVLLAVEAAAGVRYMRKQRLWALVPLALALAFLSKPIPSVYVLPIVGLVCALAETERRRAAAALSAGALAGVALVLGTFWACGVPLDRLGPSLFGASSELGVQRLVRLWERPEHAATVRDLVRAGFHRPSVYAAALGGAALLIASLRARPGRRGETLSAALALALLAVGPAFALFTWNEGENALAYVFPSLGLAVVGLRHHLAPHPEPGADEGRRRAWAAPTVVALGLALAAVEALRFDRQVNAPRRVHAGLMLEIPAPEPGVLPPALAFLRWHPFGFSPCTAHEFADLVAFLSEAEGAFFLIGDSSILYGVTGKPSLNPVLWFHPGLTLPPPGTPAFRIYQDRVLARMRAERARYVVVEGRSTWLGLRRAHFARLFERLGGVTPRARFGPFVVLEVAEPAS